MSEAMPSRRAVLAGGVTGGAALAAAGYATPSYGDAYDRAKPKKRVRLTVLGTTDLHGNVYNWDYFKNAEFDNAKHDDIGLAKATTLIKAMRKKRHGEPILTLDAGDTIQGTPLAYYYAKIDPISTTVKHPMARAMNLVGYDAAALGNHEFNYGIDTLRTFEEQLDFPLLGANAVDPATKRPAFRPYVIKTYKVGGGRTLKVGVLGLTNPGIAIWDKANVEGKMEFPGLVEQASKFVPEMKKKGCDLVIVSAHSGASTSSSYGDALPYPENAASLVAAQVPHVDAILVGHAHLEVPQTFVRNEKTGQQVLLCEPYYWGMRVAVMDLIVQETYTKHGKLKWVLVASGSQLLNSNTVAADPAVAGAVQAQHDTVVDYVNSPIGTSTEELLAARAVVEDVPIIDFVNFVQADAVKAGLDRSRRVAAGPVDRGAVQPGRVVPVRAGHRPRRRGSLHLRQHPARREGVRGRRTRLPGVLRALLQAGLRHRPVHDGPGDQRGDGDRPQRHARLQLRRGRRPRRAAHLRHRHLEGAWVPDRLSGVRREAGRGRPAVRDGGQQLPPVRWWRLPRGLHRDGRLQPPERDPAAAHRLGHRERDHRPRRLRVRRLAARVGWAPITVT